MNDTPNEHERKTQVPPPLGDILLLRYLEQHPGTTARQLKDEGLLPSGPDSAGFLARMTASGYIDAPAGEKRPRYHVTARGRALLAAEPAAPEKSDVEKIVDEECAPILSLHPDDKVIGHWFVSFKTGPSRSLPCDIQGHLFRRAFDGRLLFVYRFRYDAGTDSMLDDEKSAYFVDVTETGATEALKRCHQTFKAIVRKHPCKVAVPLDFIRVDGDQEELYRRLRYKPWFHVQEVVVPTEGDIRQFVKDAVNAVSATPSRKP